MTKSIFPAHDSPMSALIRAHDWSATPLGPMQSWPQSLKTAIDLVLANRFPTVLAWGPELTCIYNDTYRPLLGDKPEALGRPFLEVWEEARDIVAPMIERALAGEASYFENMPFSLTRYGYPEETYFTFCFSHVRDETGAIAGFLNNAVETTKQVLADRALRASETRLAQLAAVVEQSSDFIGVCDPEGTPLYVNEAGLRLMGLPDLDAACAVHFTEYFAERDRSIVRDKALPACERDGYWEGELTFRRFDDGREFPVLYNIFPVTTAEGRTIGYATVTRDLTDNKRAEDALRETLTRLARVSAIGEITASISHEINQPLAAIVANGNAGLRWLAHATPNLHEAQEALRRIVSDGHRASQTIASVRAMFKRDAQERVPLDVNDLIQEVLALLHGELLKQHVSVQNDLDRGTPAVLGDRVQLQLVILNLMTNGVDAMRSVTDRPRLLRVKSGAHQSDSVLITVEDSGTGIDPKKVDPRALRYESRRNGTWAVDLSVDHRSSWRAPVGIAGEPAWIGLSDFVASS